MWKGSVKSAIESFTNKMKKRVLRRSDETIKLSSKSIKNQQKYFAMSLCRMNRMLYFL